MCTRKCVKYYTNDSNFLKSNVVNDVYGTSSINSSHQTMSAIIYSDEALTISIGRVSINESVTTVDSRTYVTDAITLFNNDNNSTLSYTISYTGTRPVDQKIRTVSYGGTNYHYGLNKVSTLFSNTGLITYSIHE